jgi:dTDP-4-dehydrorhamnose reductase
MRRLLVTGASGLLGLPLALDATRAGYTVTGVVNSHRLNNPPFAQVAADFSEPGCAAAILEQAAPDLVVHCAALANLDAAEKDPGLARRINTELPGELAYETARRSIRLVHISTDQVFDGVRGNYQEDDEPNPLGVYARTKLEGEKAVLSANPRAAVARVVFYGWSLSGRRSLAEFFYNNLAAGSPVKGFTDVFFCPLQVNELVRLLMKIAESGLSGLYHTVSRESLSKYAFGVAIARRFGLDEGLVQPTSVMDAGLAARRSPNLTLRVDKLQSALGYALPGQADGLDRFYTQQLENYPEFLHSLGQ